MKSILVRNFIENAGKANNYNNFFCKNTIYHLNKSSLNINDFLTISTRYEQRICKENHVIFYRN